MNILTHRETEIAHLVADGFSDKEIARILGICPCTVTAHCQNMRHKLGASNRAHLVTKAFRMGILTANLFMAILAGLGGDGDIRRAPRTQARGRTSFGRSARKWHLAT